MEKAENNTNELTNVTIEQIDIKTKKRLEKELSRIDNKIDEFYGLKRKADNTLKNVLKRKEYLTEVLKKQ